MGLSPSYLHTSRSGERQAQYTTVYHSIPQYITVYHSIPQYTTVYHSILSLGITLRDISRFSAPHISICVSKVPILKKKSRSNANMQPSITGVYISLHMMNGQRVHCELKTHNKEKNEGPKMSPTQRLYRMNALSPCVIIRPPPLLIRWNLNPSELERPSEPSSFNRTSTVVDVHKVLTMYGIDSW